MEIHDKKYQATLRQATEADHHLETYDHTKLAAINTCPTWGILRYQMHKRMPMEGRSLALEAGSAMHEVFAWVRLVTLLDQLKSIGRTTLFLDQLWHYHGTRLFGEDRLYLLREATKDATDVSDVATRGAIVVLDTSGFYDDPRDKRRTLSNLEECAYAYINRWRWDHPVWMRDSLDASSDVGIEIPFDVVVDIAGADLQPLRLTGRIDGIHYDLLNRLTTHDNKTASRLGDAWTNAMPVSHQFTGYCAAASVFTQQEVSRCDVLGLAIPLPRAYDYGGFAREQFVREPHHYARWLQWLVHTVSMTREYANDPYGAPLYTHSCNRYFKACQFIPFCFGDREEQERIMEEMIDDVWSPLDKPILDGVGNE